MTETIAVGVDIGGTKIALAAATYDGRVLAQDVVPTHPAEGVDSVIERLARGIGNVVAEVGYKVKVAGVGVACPGPVDAARGIAMHAVNLAWHNVPLRDKLRAKLALNAPIVLANDINSAALGEMIFGAARGVRDFAFIVIGTGLGGAAVIDGRIVNGVSGSAMEIGHVSLDRAGRLCNCGTHGCAEMYVSGKGLMAAAMEYMPHYPDSPLSSDNGSLTTGAILAAARAGDSLAARIMSEAAEALGIVMAWSATVVNPALIVIGGGLAQAAGDLLWDAALASFHERVLPSIREPLTVVRSQLETPALGAAALVWSR
jgi:glucokinase